MTGQRNDSDPLQILRQRVRTLAMRQSPEWYRIENRAEVADVYIYDEIGYWGTTAADFVRELRALDVDNINLHINSPGGDVFDGIAIYNSLKNHRAQVEVHIDGIAASIASVIAMAGDRVVMEPHSRMMIHEAWGIVLGNSEDMQKMAERLDATSENIASIYAERSGKDASFWRDQMKAEAWYSDQQAVDAGLADEVGRSEGAKNDLRSFDLSIFRNAAGAPADVVAAEQPRDEEEAPPEDDSQESLENANPLAELRAELEQRFSNPPINAELEVALDRVLTGRS